MSTVGDFLLERLQEWGVRRVYGYPGDGINGILAAFGRQDAIEFVQTRHEEMAAFEHAEILREEVPVEADCAVVLPFLGVRPRVWSGRGQIHQPVVVFAATRATPLARQRGERRCALAAEPAHSAAGR